MKKEKTCKSPVIGERERERERESKIIFKYIVISFVLFPFSASSQNVWDCDEPNPHSAGSLTNTLINNYHRVCRTGYASFGNIPKDK